MVVLVAFTLSACNVGGSKLNNPTDQQTDIQQIANDYLNKYKATDGFTAVSVTVQCNRFDRSLPVTIYEGTLGRSDYSPLTNNNLWQIGSNTKSFTAIVLLQLENEYPNFSIEDDITKWFPEYTYWQDPVTHKGPTVHQLMNMTTGIPDDMNSSFFSWDVNNTLNYLPTENMIAFALKSLLYSSGSNWNYSNSKFINWKNHRKKL